MAMKRHAEPGSARGWPFAASGALAAALLLGIAEIASALFSPVSSPLVAVGAAFIDITPSWLKDFAIDVFGTADKLVLMVSMGVVALALAAVLGLIARRRLTLASVLCAAIAVLLGAAVLSRPATGWLDLLPTVLGGVAGIAALNWLVRLAHRRTVPVGDSPGPEPTEGGAARPARPEAARRTFLIGAGLTAVVAVATMAGGRALSAVSTAAAATRDALRLPGARRTAAPLPQGVGAPAPGMPPFVTPNGDFYRIDTALAVPRIDPSTWELRVHGMVEEEFTLSFTELLELDLQESWVTLTCVSNPVGGELAGNAKWLGYPLQDLLARARPQEGADMVLSTSVDGFSASTPLDVLTDGRDALLAVGMNGEPLPLEHGFPVRMVVPGLYGYVSATKWVVDLEVTRFADKTAYWTDRGWAERGPIKLASRIDVPRGFEAVPTGATVLGGTAWSQTIGIDRVQVQVDDGAWQDATLAAEATVDTWRQWSLEWEGEPGNHKARVRAVNRDGEVQTSDRADTVPDGASGWHEVQFRVE
ncbi:DMSO/TMAO reductase YedYZ molybdopterin-dependent catalytic subunit [Citricoccus sp. K5]|nr:DMSO/TMAO reductase YedYZ molybdopterin-dependent catalytic subunit [Citricoccus sp. K5]